MYCHKCPLTPFVAYVKLITKNRLNSRSIYSILTGNLRESTADEVKPVIYFRLKSVINRARKGKTELIDNTYIEIVEGEGIYVYTLYGKRGTDYIPILTTGGTKYEDERKFLWDTLESMATKKYGDQYTRKIPVACPYVLDIIHTSAAYFINTLSWTGDFTKCLGWMMLFPDEVRPK